MRIFYASIDSANNIELPNSRVWHNNLYQTLVKQFEVVRPQYSLQEQHIRCVYNVYDSKEKDRKRFSELLFQEIKKENSKKRIDLFFSYFWTASILSEIVDKIKDLGIITVNFYCNNIHQFDLVSEIAPHFDYCMFPEKMAESSYRAIGANPVHIQMAANPAVYRPYDVPKEYDVTFVGQKYLNRPEYLGYLDAHGVRCDAWGPGWQNAEQGARGKSNSRNTGFAAVRNRLKAVGKRLLRGKRYSLPPERCHGPLSDENLIKMYSRSKISLGFSEVRMPDGSLHRHIRLRDFEAPMSGAFYMVGYQEELAEYYELGKEVVCYDNREELLDKVRYYLNHEAEAERIRQAGLARARRDHTWQNRFEKLFRIIGLRNA